MEKYTSFVIKHKKGIVIVFALISVFCVFLSFGVNLNYKMTDYLPSSSQSTKALKIIEEEFSGSLPNTNVMVKNVTLATAMNYKTEISNIDGVENVIWLDDTVDIKEPLEIYDTQTVEKFYKDNCALFSVTIKDGKEYETVAAIRSLVGDNGAVSGDSADISAQRSTSAEETGKAMIIVCVAILVLLVLFSDSYVHPLLFIAAIGVAILINMGTNIFFGKVSYITSMISPILQLAVSLDYAVFLIHSYDAYQREGLSTEDAMKAAIKKSIKAVSASALTTLCGFLALSFMKFRIGADLGINLTKGVVLSFVSCVFFLPALTLLLQKSIEKTKHKPFLPLFKSVDNVFAKVRIPVFALVIVLIIPCFLGQSKVGFIYGNEEADKSSITWQQKNDIESEFGKNTIMAIMVPKGDVLKEYELSEDLKHVKNVDSVISYAESVGVGIPSEFVGDDVISTFYSKNYARIILYLGTNNEGEEAFSTVKNINQTVQKYYENFYSAGQSANLYDMKRVVDEDNIRVELIVIISILLVLLITFRSAMLPIILVFAIEAGIWINLAIPYFTGDALNFIGYLIISTVQLGATVDYAILYTTYYMDNRKHMSPKKAVFTSMGETFKSTLLSGTTLSFSGFALYFTSTNPMISGLGLLLGRGTLLSLLMVYCVLPLLLRILDKPIGKLTYHSKFLNSSERR